MSDYEEIPEKKQDPAYTVAMQQLFEKLMYTIKICDICCKADIDEKTRAEVMMLEDIIKLAKSHAHRLNHKKIKELR